MPKGCLGFIILASITVHDLIKIDKNVEKTPKNHLPFSSHRHAGQNKVFVSDMR